MLFKFSFSSTTADTMKLLIFLLAALFVANAEQSSEETSAIPIETFRDFHKIFTSNGPQKWMGDNEDKLQAMCEKVLQSQERGWDSDLTFTENQRKDLYKFENQNEFLTHLRDVRECCQKTSSFDKKLCFKAMRENFLDDYCEQGANHLCCRSENAERFACFGKKVTSGYTTRELGVDDVKPLPSGIKIRLGPQLMENEEETQTSHDEQEDTITDIWEQLEVEQMSTDGQCMNGFFPENDLPDTEQSAVSDVCEEGDDTMARGQAKGCCRLGAFVGKKYVTKKGCSYLQCRRFFRMFRKRHPRCIKNKFVCGFFFVECCQRQHHKDFYLGQRDVEVDIGQPETEIFNEMPNQNRVKKVGPGTEQRPIRWE